MIVFLGNSRTTKLYSDVVKGSYDDKDIVVSCQYPFKIPPSLINSHICVNIHYGRLPEYAGCNPVFWQIINGEFHAGVTLHYVDPCWDSGDIIDIGYVPIGEKTADVVYKELEKKGLELFKRYYKGILDGTCPRRPQDLKKRNYYKQGIVDWNKELDPKSPNFAREYQAYYFEGKQLPRIKL